VSGNGKGGGEDDVKSSGSVTGGVSERRQGAGQWLTPPLNQVEAELDRALDQAAAADTDEVALRRVWSRLAQIPELVPARAEMPPPRRARWPWIAAASLAGAAAAVTFMLLGPAPLNRARNVVAQAPSVSAPLRRDAERSRLVAPATVRTANGEVLHLALKGGTEVTVTSNSTLVLDEDERPTVSAGEVQFHVPPQPAGHTFSVRASGYRVVVVGTRFRVSVSDGVGVGVVGVGVEEGIVEVWNSDRRLARLTPGESWESTSAVPNGGTPSATEASETNGNDEKAPSSRHLVPSSRPLRATHGLRASLGAVAGSPASSSGTNDNALLGSSDKTLPLTSERLSAPTVGDTKNATTATPPGAATPTAATPVPSDAAALGAQAHAARAAGDSRKALGIYRLLAQRGGAAGENAEYESGRILRDDLHQPREAIAVWRGYRAQHPRGLLRIESDISLIETLVVVNDKTEALSEAQDFVHRFPDNERRGELGGLAGDLLREQGDFRGALTEYDGALDSGRGRREVIDALSFHRSVCVLHLDRDLGESALRAYLQVFPAGHFRSQADRLLVDQSRTAQAHRP
jgi:ferric-dicitrate binding protein FerR (iron transport regulator)